MSRWWGIVCLVLSLVVLVAERAVHAQVTVTLEADRDNTIYEENQNSNGAGLTVTIGRTSGNMGTLSRRALLRFDVASSLPVGATGLVLRRFSRAHPRVASKAAQHIGT